MKISASVKDIQNLEKILIGSLGLRRGVFVAHEGGQVRKNTQNPAEPSRCFVRRYRVAIEMSKRAFETKWCPVTFEYDERYNDAHMIIPDMHLNNLLARFPKWTEPVRDIRYQNYRRYQYAEHDDSQDKAGQKADALDTRDGNAEGLRREGSTI